MGSYLEMSQIKRARAAILVNSAWNVKNFRESLLENMTAKNIDVIVVIPEDDDSDALSHISCEVMKVPLSRKSINPFADLKLLLTYIKVLKAVSPDVILTFTIKPNIYGNIAGRLLGVPVISTITGLGRTFIHKNWLTKFVKLLYYIALASAEKVFFQNQDDLTLFCREKILNPAGAEVIPGSGIDLDRFSPCDDDLRNKTFFTFLFVGRMLWDKGVGEFVKASHEISKSHPDVVCQCLGPLDFDNPSAVSERQVLEWSESGIIQYLGVSSDVRQQMMMADCIVLPSYREGLPRVLLEASALERPVISTDVPGCRDVICDNVTGLLCDPHNTTDLAEKMVQMVSLPEAKRSKMGAAGRHYIEKYFSSSVVNDRYLTVIFSITGVRQVIDD